MDTARVILLEQNNAPFLQALANYVEPLRSALDTSADEEKLAENQLLCQRIMEFVAGNVGGHETFLQPAADSQPVDLLIYVHCLIARSCSKNSKSLFLELAQEVAEFILAVPEVKRADWIEGILLELTQAHVATKEYSKAAQVCLVHSKLMKLNLNRKLLLLSSAARYWWQGGELEKSIEVTKEALAASTQLGVSEWKSQAKLQMSIATLFDKKGQTADAVAARKHAWDICAHADDFSDEYIVRGMVSLLRHYRSQRSWSLARKLVKSVDAHILEHFDDTQLGQNWHILKNSIARDMEDRETADTIFKKIRAEGEDRHWIELKKKRGFLNCHANNGRWQKALEGSKFILLKLQDLSPSVAPWKYGEEMDIHIFRHVCFEAMGDEESADLELEKAVTLQEFGGDERIPEMMVFVYCLQSTAAIRRNDCAEAHRLLGLAETIMPACNQPLIIVTIKSHRARLLDHQGQYMEAAIIAREAILLAADQQRQLCSQDNEPTSWLFFFSKHLTKIFWLLEELCIWRLKMPQNGLLWAERSRLRFLMHQVYSQHVETAIPDPAVLDECDQQLMMVIKGVVEGLGPKTAIIEYSYTEYYSYNEDHESEEKSVIYMYVVRLSPTNDQRTMAYHRICQFGNWLQDAGLPTHTKLKELIEDACPELDSKADETKRMKALSTLHSLLVQFVEDEIEGCDTLVFSPGHGCLATVPFHALYDDKKQEFLIESRGVSVIPSIVALHRCLCGQQKFETNLQLPNASVQVISSDLGTSQRQSQVDRRIHSKVAFIAGNPEPMGLKRLHLQQLPYAEREAKEVASYFKVNPCLGKNMTKQAVLEGLSTNSVVLLATHGVIEDRYPHGCLVLQAPTRPDDDFASTTDIMQDDDSEKGGRRSLRVFEDTATEEADQVLTAAEIGALEGGVSAGLVVLSVCESGLGEATHGEGLLGLGRALLKAGALTAILTLWKVSERPTYEFMTRLFKELTSAALRGRNVCECMRIVMCDMIAKKEPVRDWAPFTILGLPTLRLSMPKDNRGMSGLDKHSYPLFSTSNSCPYPCKVCDASIVNKPRGFLLEDPNNVYAGLAHLGGRGQLEEAMRRGARIKPAREVSERFKLAEASGIPLYFILGQPVDSNSSEFLI